jgi:hypothetical protein
LKDNKTEIIYIRPDGRGVCLTRKNWVDLEHQYSSGFYVITIRPLKEEEKTDAEQD